MDQKRITAILELPGGPAFAAADGRVLCAVNGAEALGFSVGAPFSDLLRGLGLPSPGDAPLEALVPLGRDVWQLRATAETDCVLCFLRPAVSTNQAPNEGTLLRAAGSIRLALNEVNAALDSLTLSAESKDQVRGGALALRSVYRLRRTAEALELFARLRSGTYRPRGQEVAVLPTVLAFLGELGELLRPTGLRLSWTLPKRDFRLCLDWPLLSVLLLELIANAAANSADGRIQVRLTRPDEQRLLFAVSNRTDGPLPEALARIHTDPGQSLSAGLGLGISLISAGAAGHGGSLLLSAEADGTVTALLSAAALSPAEPDVRNCFQLPTGAEAALIVHSSILPPESYRPEDLL